MAGHRQVHPLAKARRQQNLFLLTAGKCRQILPELCPLKIHFPQDRFEQTFIQSAFLYEPAQVPSEKRRVLRNEGHSNTSSAENRSPVCECFPGNQQEQAGLSAAIVTVQRNPFPAAELRETEFSCFLRSKPIPPTGLAAAPNDIGQCSFAAGCSAPPHSSACAQNSPSM